MIRVGLDARVDPMREFERLITGLWRSLHAREARIVVQGLMATAPEHRGSFRWQPSSITSPVDDHYLDLDARNDFRVCAEMEPPVMWCELRPALEQVP